MRHKKPGPVGGCDMVENHNQNALERKLYRSFLLLSALVILLSLGISLYLDMTRQRNQVDASIGSAAAYVSKLPSVVAMLNAGYPDPSVTRNIDALCDSIPDISAAVICDQNGLRFYHTDRQKTGESYVDGEERPILEGADPYITTGYSTMGMQRRAFHAIRREDGTIIGFVMVSVFTGVLTARLRNIVLIHLVILSIMLLMSFFLTHAILRFLRRTLMGFRPEELLSRYLRQDEVLGAVAEGLVASDPSGNVLFVNSAAQALFGEGVQLVGRPVTELFPDSRQEEVLRTGKTEERRSWIVGGRSVLVGQIPIREREISAPQGVLTILYDRTEMLRMSDELFGARSMIDALRSYNHEFSNKLHVILGYLESGKIQEAIRFIVNSNLISGQLICQTADQLRVSELCALMIGKMLHAAERGIQLTLAEGSCCIEQDLPIPVEDMVTVMGNLLENAIEELSSGEHSVKEIEFGLYCRPDCSLLVCTDTGGGILPEVRPHIFEKGVSAKGPYRGTGLYAVQSVVRRYGGKIDVETEPGEGTSFTITFTRKETD
jgi:sensor histidine kinase regulating citrate/malate metabolism